MLGQLLHRDRVYPNYRSMAQAKAFAPAKLIIGIIAGEAGVFEKAEKALVTMFGPVDFRSPVFPFETTEYYAKEMGPGLKRLFLSFAELVPPDELAAIKLRTNELEAEIGKSYPELHRAVNIDPGILTAAALIMGTAKDFAHRVPLRGGIYAHLELLFGREDVRFLEWTYPDFRQPGYRDFFLEVRKAYLTRLRSDRTYQS